MTPDSTGPPGGPDRNTQLLRGTLDMCLLALLAQRPTHGYDLVRRLAATGLDPVSYGTIYPLLTRMRRLGLVSDDEVDSRTGPPRKVYAPTPEGRRVLRTWIGQWREFATTIDAVITEAGRELPEPQAATATEERKAGTT